MSAARPRIGISRCLLGDRVRYDGGHKRADSVIDAFDGLVEWVPVCPEVEAGLPVPRPAMQLRTTPDGRTRIAEVATGADWTPAFRSWADRRLDELRRASLDGFILKKNSPSCGRDVEVFDDGRLAVGRGRGVWADALGAAFPDMPMEEEDRLSEAGARHEFLTRARAYAASRKSRLAAPGVRRITVERVGGAARQQREDAVAVEEPMEVRVNGEPFAVVMRTPGADRELAAGFLLAEDVIWGSHELGAIELCEDVDEEARGNVINVTVTGGAIGRLGARLGERRQVMMTASCGLCGRRTIDTLRSRVDAVGGDWTVSASLIASLPARLRSAQSVFESTGGLHAAGLFDLEGDLQLIAEDVGRHNAVDKISGRKLIEDALPLDRSLLLVSGRTSFELVQKALLAGIPLIAAVSAPSSLAIELAAASGITLCGFVRGEEFNVYAHARRVR